MFDNEVLHQQNNIHIRTDLLLVGRSWKFSVGVFLLLIGKLKASHVSTTAEFTLIKMIYVEIGTIKS